MKKLLAKMVVLMLFARPFHLILGSRWTWCSVAFFTFLYKNIFAPFSVFSYYLSRRAAMTNYTVGKFTAMLFKN
ncbi:hypothetical protein [Salmonella phage Tennessee]